MLSVYAIDILQEIRREILDAKVIWREISHRRPRPSYILFIYLSVQFITVLLIIIINMYNYMIAM